MRSAADNRKATLDHIPLGRIGETDDVVGTVVFLASPAASLITGANLLVAVDGPPPEAEDPARQRDGQRIGPPAAIPTSITLRPIRVPQCQF